MTAPALTAQALAALHAAGFEKSWPVSDFEDHIARITDVITPLYDKMALIGFALIRVAEDQGDILTITIHPDHRGKGLGTKLLEDAQRDAKTQGAQVLFLDVAVDNPAAIALYRRAGFLEYGRRPGYYRRENRRVGAVLFQKKL